MHSPICMHSVHSLICALCGPPLLTMLLTQVNGEDLTRRERLPSTAFRDAQAGDCETAALAELIHASSHGGLVAPWRAFDADI